MRTPTAEQIQQITSRLRVYGHIEGKNVFYWFQNHKARQRQKQKQECMLYFNHFLHKPLPNLFTPSPPPLINNVDCNPYYMPQSSIGYYPQQHHMKMPPPSGVMVPRKPNRPSDAKEDTTISDSVGSNVGNNIKCHETLPLFPLHPTGTLKQRSSTPAVPPQSGNVNPSISTGRAGLDVVRRGGGDVGAANPSFIDFFAGSSCFQ
ncbi:hypothetical protein Scep_003211 [Stephania cephalantha]|uniref:Homeobox domain-containing protein n=1 Tax=Stephania cephalantha TaxID=152367 RepID=A0AAP0PU75_9MAGN